jgi:hypothetical protein
MDIIFLPHTQLTQAQQDRQSISDLPLLYSAYGVGTTSNRSARLGQMML